jgi:hypothetical protein
MPHDTTSAHADTTASDQDRTHKIQSLREMINNAEQTMQSAKAMLLQLEGKKKLGRKRKVEDIEDGSVVEGAFDGQIMLGNDGKHYPIPANYASKSKLVQGDILKLTITEDGSFIYKQIGPADRKHAIGIVSQDETGNYFVVADNQAYHVLLASITYFKAEPGDEVAIVLPRQLEASWCAIENILQKSNSLNWQGARPTPRVVPAPRPITDMEHWKKDLKAVHNHETDPAPIVPIPKETPAKKISEDSVDTALADTTPTTPKVDEIEAPITPEETPVAATSATPEIDEAEAERLRQEIIDEWLKDTTPSPAENV